MDAPPETGTPLLPEDISDDREPARPERLPSRKENGPQERLGRADSSGDGDRLAGTDPEQTRKISVLPDPEGRMPERPEITPVLAGRDPSSWELLFRLPRSVRRPSRDFCDFGPFIQESKKSIIKTWV